MKVCRRGQLTPVAVDPDPVALGLSPLSPGGIFEAPAPELMESSGMKIFEAGAQVHHNSYSKAGFKSLKVEIRIYGLLLAASF